MIIPPIWYTIVPTITISTIGLKNTINLKDYNSFTDALNESSNMILIFLNGILKTIVFGIWIYPIIGILKKIIPNIPKHNLVFYLRNYGTLIIIWKLGKVYYNIIYIIIIKLFFKKINFMELFYLNSINLIYFVNKVNDPLTTRFARLRARNLF